MYSNLRPEAIVATLEQLNRRIEERFPEASLGRVNAELLTLARGAKENSEHIARPWRWVRVVEWALIVALVTGNVLIVTHFRLEGVAFDLPMLIQLLESAVNLVVLLGAAILFVAGVERRMKRARSLAAIHELRSIAHIIDMHQLTKDPERPLGRQSTPSSPAVNMTAYELRRYLDYCSEMLSLAGKVSALYVQSFSDPVVLSAVNDLESLTTGLSSKIWHKMAVPHQALHAFPSER